MDAHPRGSSIGTSFPNWKDQPQCLRQDFRHPNAEKGLLHKRHLGLASAVIGDNRSELSSIHYSIYGQKIGRKMLSSLAGNASSSRTLLRSINRIRTPLYCSHTHAESSFHFQSPLQLQHRSLSSSTVGTRSLSFQKVCALGHTSFAAQKGTRSFFSTPKPGSKENGAGQSRSGLNHHTREIKAVFYKDLAKFKGGRPNFQPTSYQTPVDIKEIEIGNSRSGGQSLGENL